MRNRRIIASGTLQGGHIDCPVIITGEYEEFGADPVVCEIIPDMSYIAQYNEKRPSYSDRLSVWGNTDEGEQIFIPDFQVSSYKSYAGHGYTHKNPKQLVWTTTADNFVKGQLGEFESAGGEVLCTLFTSPSPFANSGVIYLKGDDGQIKIMDDAERRGVKWLTPFGEAEYTDKYDYLPNEQVGINPAITQIWRGCIRLSVTPTDRVALEKLLIDIQKYFDDVLWLMSFLARRRIVWYEGEAHFFPSEQNSDSRMAFLRRNKWLGHIDDRIVQHPLISRNILRDGLFQQLLNHYQASPFQEIIHQTIIHLLPSYERVYLENQYTSVYTGLEGLVFGLDSDNSIGRLVGKSPFRRIRKKVEEVLKNELDSDVFKEMCRKIPELQRRSFVDQLLLQLQRHQIDLGVLWPKSEVAENLSALIRRRNVYLHQGRMKDITKYAEDIEKIQHLLETWILSLLGCPAESMSMLAKPHFLS